MVTERDVKVSVFRRGRRVAQCYERCVVELTPGKYEFWVHPGPGTVSGSREITVDGAMTLEFDPDTELHRWGGVALSVIGIGALVGTVAFLFTPPHECQTETVEGKDCSLLKPLLLTAMVATPVGLTMLGTSIRPEFKLEPEDPERLRARRKSRSQLVRLRAPARSVPPQISAAAIPTRTGGMLGFGVAF